MKYSKLDQQLIEKAVTFLISNYNATGHNEKPVILHSLRVAFNLMGIGHNIEVIIAAILHDLVEDADVSMDMISKAFGVNVASIVAAVSFNPDIEDYEIQYKDTFNNCVKQGVAALYVKAADILDNSDYYSLVKKDFRIKPWEKAKYFLEISEPIIGDSKIWRDLKSKLDKVGL